jgi:CheY-like chemotaxis protein
MHKTVEHILQFERSMHLFYLDLATAFKGEKHIYDFLRNLAADEMDHLKILAKAAKDQEPDHASKPFIALDEDALEEFKAPQREMWEKCKQYPPTLESLLHCIVNLEFSEWNDIFFYVVETLIGNDKSSLRELEKFQRHRTRIERFLNSVPAGKRYLKVMRDLPLLVDEKILVVDDNPTIIDLVEAVIKNLGRVDKAYNGEEGMEKLSKHYYRLILSDVDMPVMDGMQFFENAVQQYPQIGERFLFFTGDGSPDRLAFFIENNLRYCIKPIPLQIIRDTMMDMMNMTPEDHEYRGPRNQ